MFFAIRNENEEVFSGINRLFERRNRDDAGSEKLQNNRSICWGVYCEWNSLNRN